MKQSQPAKTVKKKKVKVKTVKQNTFGKKKIKKWSRKVEQVFFETLNDLLQNGYTLPRSLEVMQVILPRLAGDLQTVQISLNNGSSVVDSLEPFVHANILDELALVQLHGCQLALLKSIGEREKQYQQQLKQLWATLAYPILLFGIIGGIVLYLGTYLLPTTDNALISFLGMGMVSFIVFMIGCILWFFKQTKVRRYHLVIRLPLIGPVVKLVVQQALYLQLGYLLESGVSLQVVANYCQEHPKQWVCQLIGQSVQVAWEKGETLETGLNEVQYLTEEAKSLFMRGKPTELIGRDLIQLARHLNVRQKQRVMTLMAYVQPICFMIIGGLVVGLYMALLLPLYDQMLGMGE